MTFGRPKTYFLVCVAPSRDCSIDESKRCMAFYHFCVHCITDKSPFATAESGPIKGTETCDACNLWDRAKHERGLSIERYLDCNSSGRPNTKRRKNDLRKNSEAASGIVAKRRYFSRVSTKVAVPAQPTVRQKVWSLINNTWRGRERKNWVGSHWKSWLTLHVRKTRFTFHIHDIVIPITARPHF